MTRGILCGTTVTIFSVMSQLNVFALSVNIQFSDPSAKIGEELTVSMHVQGDNATSNADTVFSYDSEKMELISGDNASGSDGELTIRNGGGEEESDVYCSFRLKVSKGGSTAVQVKDVKLADSNQEATIAYQGSAAIIVAATGAMAGSSTTGTAVASMEAIEPFSNLSLNPGTLTPTFDAGNTVYTTVIREEVTRITANVVSATGGARVNVTGNENLKLGENKIEVNVLGSDNSTLDTYTTIVTKQQGTTPETVPIEDSTHATIGTTSYTIADSFDRALFPADYENESFIYGDWAVQAGKGSGEHPHLICLPADGGSGSLYFYDDTSGTWSPHVQVSATAKAVSVVSLPEGVAIPGGLLVKQVTLSGKTIDGHIGQKDQGQNYCVFYGMDSKGEKGFYRFDLQEETLQRYFSGDGAGQSTTE